MDALLANPAIIVTFHIILIAAILGVLFGYAVPLLAYARSSPSNPDKYPYYDWQTLSSARKPLSDLSGTILQQPIINFKIATAAFGGIYTEESKNGLNPYIGTVDPEAARLQVLAGARAIIFDIWPDPANPTQPVVCAMRDNDSDAVEKWWINTGGLTRGVGRYSNWKMVTRNKVPVAQMLDAAVSTAFGQGNQQTDPFFLILKLHGAMTVPYLNTLGTQVAGALGGKSFSSTDTNTTNTNSYCSTPISQFMGQRAFVIVIPDVQSNYNLLPGVNTYDAFLQQFRTTSLAQYTNAIESSANQIFFDIQNVGSVAAATQTPCGGGGGALVPAYKAGFVVVQPSAGPTDTRNASLFSGTSYATALQSGAQFVGLNLFSQVKSDPSIETYLSDTWFSTYSFKTGA
jgi:hypothetical protein